MPTSPERIAIFDYVNGRLIVREVENANEDAALAIANEEGIKLDDCEWMGGTLTLDIQS